MTSKLTRIVLLILLAAGACGTATTGGTTTTSTESTSAPTTATTEDTEDPQDTEDTAQPSTTDDVGQDSQTGSLAISLEPVNGVFIEGFEIGLRVESPEGEVLFATLWTDFVEAQGETSLSRYYDAVLTREFPTGPVVVLATVNIGAGPAPVTPDINGDLNCSLEVDIPSDSQAGVEISFDGTSNCLREI